MSYCRDQLKSVFLAILLLDAEIHYLFSGYPQVTVKTPKHWLLLPEAE